MRKEIWKDTIFKAFSTLLLFAILGPLTTGHTVALDDEPSEQVEIDSIEDLQAMRENLDGNYVLVSDIDASETENWNDGSGFDPIGGEDFPFTGSIDGQGHTISNLYSDRRDKNNVGLFWAIGVQNEVGTVENLDLENVRVIGGKWVGALAGAVNKGVLSGCCSTGKVKGNRLVGGLIGHSGGFLGNSCSSAEVDGEWDVGGLVGALGGDLDTSHSDGSVTGDTYVGGLVGKVVDSGTISACFSTASVEGTRRKIGGLAGFNEGEIANSYSVGTVAGSESKGGGLV